MKKEKYRTVIISDVHLGIRESKSDELIKFLDSVRFDTLILNGDIIDGWALKTGSKWKNKHTDCIKKILKISEKTDVIWLRGNHDDFLDDFLPLAITLGKLKIDREYEHLSANGKTYYVIHGDIFDVFITKMGWLAKIGSVGYDIALRLNYWYNEWRKYRGLPYFSLSKKIKDGVKSVVKLVTNFEVHVTEVAKDKGYDGIICGHIHQPSIKVISDTEYMNSGDWVENMTALVETVEGEWRIIHY
jgi:UDP-2,3-diacylglucosamine pyrophosphatase LpxH